VAGTTRKLVNIWLYWTPDQPAASEEAPTPTPRKPTKKEKRVKKERDIKAEPAVKFEVSTPTTTKRPRAASAEISVPKKNIGAITRLQTRALTAPAEDNDAGEEDLALGGIFGDT
jgi:hypothetical protein